LRWWPASPAPSFDQDPADPGAANLFADGFSMAAANYSGTKAEIEEYAQVRMEERHVQLAPKGEREEIRQIFHAKGFKGAALDSAVDVITSKRQRWIDTMMTEEHGLPGVSRSPTRAAAMTFLAFLLCGSICCCPSSPARRPPCGPRR
jgi:hypothetical protein